MRGRGQKEAWCLQNVSDETPKRLFIERPQNRKK
jgi:hypothetical protein